MPLEFAAVFKKAPAGYIGFAEELSGAAIREPLRVPAE
jgi:hypothetical protein